MEAPGKLAAFGTPKRKEGQARKKQEAVKGKAWDEKGSFTLQELRERCPPGFYATQDKFSKRWRLHSKIYRVPLTGCAWMLHGKRGAGEKLIKLAWKAYRRVHPEPAAPPS